MVWSRALSGLPARIRSDIACLPAMRALRSRMSGTRAVSQLHLRSVTTALPLAVAAAAGPALPCRLRRTRRGDDRETTDGLGVM